MPNEQDENGYWADHGLADGGTRQSFATGAVREVPAGRGRWDLIPYEPMMRLAQHYEKGALKYAARNWQKGLPLTNYLNSMSRHVFLLMSGDTTEDHAAAIAWNIFGYMWSEERLKMGLLPDHINDVDPIPNVMATEKSTTAIKKGGVYLPPDSGIHPPFAHATDRRYITKAHVDAIRNKAGLKPTQYIDIEGVK